MAFLQKDKQFRQEISSCLLFQTIWKIFRFLQIAENEGILINRNIDLYLPDCCLNELLHITLKLLTLSPKCFSYLGPPFLIFGAVTWAFPGWAESTSGNQSEQDASTVLSGFTAWTQAPNYNFYFHNWFWTILL